MGLKTGEVDSLIHKAPGDWSKEDSKPPWAGALIRLADAAETRPRFAAAIFALAAVWAALSGVPAWPRVQSSVGGDALGIQAVMALSYERSPLYWFLNPSIDERSFRPFCMLLHWVEFRLWGLRDASYLWLSLGIHVANVVLLAALVAILARGPILLRLSLGLFAACVFSGVQIVGPSLAVDSIASFWPSQSDAAAMTFGLLGLILLVKCVQDGSLQTFVLSAIAFWCAVWFKEIAFIAIILGIGLAIQSPHLHCNRRIWIATALVLEAMTLWLIRWNILGGTSAYNPSTDLDRLIPFLVPIRIRSGMEAGWPIWSALAWLIATVLLRTQILQGRFAAVGCGIAGIIAVSVFSGNWGHLLLSETWSALIEGAVFWLGVSGIVISIFKVPIFRPIFLAWLLSMYIVSPFKVTMGWYRYWPEGLGAVVEALALPASITTLCWLIGFRMRMPALAWPRLQIHTCVRRIPRLAFLASACITFGVISAANGLNDRWSLVKFEESVNDANLQVTRIHLKTLRKAARPLVILPGDDYPVQWDRSDKRTEVTGALARLGYDVHVVRMGEHNSVKSLAAVTMWLRDNKWSTTGIALMGWSESASLALHIASNSALDLKIQTACAIVNQESVNAASAPARKILTDLRGGPAVFLAVSKEDWPAFQKKLGPSRRKLELPRPRLRVTVPYNEGPVFPNEPNHWKRTLDQAIEHLVINAPPDSTL